MYGELLFKLANGTLSIPEMEELRLIGNRLEEDGLLVRSWQKRDKKFNEEFLDLPFYVIHSQVLEKDTASITVEIPPGTTNIHIAGNGGIDQATGGTIWAQFNGDTGTNYEYTYILGNSTTVTTGSSTSQTHVPLGLFSNTNDPVGNSSSLETIINNINSAYHKTSLARTYYNDGTTRSFYDFGGKWKSTAAIHKIEIYGTDNTSVKGTASLKTDSSISVYGMI